jgi:hypothetical protein
LSLSSQTRYIRCQIAVLDRRIFGGEQTEIHRSVKNVCDDLDKSLYFLTPGLGCLCEKHAVWVHDNHILFPYMLR